MKNDSWKNLLNPETLKSNLIISSMYITAFELLKDNIEHYPKVFFSEGYNSKGMKLGQSYKEKVSSLNKSHVYAALEWFKNMEAITEEDIKKFNEIKNFRNKLVHEMGERMFKGIDQEKYTELFANLFYLFEKIDLWWIKNFELALNTEIDLEGADVESALSSELLMIRVMMDIVSSDEEDSWMYYNSIFKSENNEK